MDRESLGMLRNYDAFVFDWDGTLSSLKLLRALNERLNPYWRYKKRKGREGMGEGSREDIDKSIRRKERSRGRRLVTPLIDVSMVFLKPKLHNDSRTVLDTLRRRGKKIALFTNGSSYRVLKELSYLGIEDYFEVIVSAQDLKALKPDPIGLKVVISAIKSKKGRVLYVGDMVDDVLMAKSMGVDCCAVADGFDSYGRLKAARPNYLFRSMEEFCAAL